MEPYVSTIAKKSAALGRRVAIGTDVFNRDMALAAPGRISANRCCRMIQAYDGWVAVNLPRDSDVELVPAWLGRDVGEEVWTAVERWAPTLAASFLVDRARLLGLAVCGVGATRVLGVRSVLGGASGPVGRRVLDLSSLWAGPLCGSILAAAGFDVTKLESASRRDPVAVGAPGLGRRLNGGKTLATVDFGDGPALRAYLDASDVVVSSARPRAFDALGIDAARWLASKPGRVWVAITAHGWFGEGSDRVGFGDDCAAAGGLVRWTADGAPHFIGDARADPLTGLAAAAAALTAICRGGGVLIDAALARVAAEVAHSRGETCTTS